MELLLRFWRVAVVLAVAGAFVACNSVPTVKEVTPNAGPETGGTVVTVTGMNFKKGAVVTVNSHLVPGAKVVSGSQIQFTMPAGQTGSAMVEVVNPKEVPSGKPVSFEYMDSTPPVAESVSPVGDFTHDAVPADVRVQFSEAITAGQVVVTDEAQKPVEGATTIAENTLVFTPTAPFAPGHTYDVAVTDVVDSADNPGTGGSGSFTIAAAPVAKKAPTRRARK